MQTPSSELLIEYALNSTIRPHFLSVTKEEDCILILLSHPSFLLLDMASRVSLVFNLINKANPDIIKNNMLVVQPFSSGEMMDVFEHWAK